MRLLRPYIYIAFTPHIYQTHLPHITRHIYYTRASAREACEHAGEKESERAREYCFDTALDRERESFREREREREYCFDALKLP